MNPRRSFFRKIAYLVAIGVLLMPLFWLGRPATTGVEGVKRSPGGKLARLRAENGLAEAQIGEIDPTSETIKLATLGMRGVAANILWGKAQRYKMKKDWTNLSATLEQLIKLEPHFIGVWRFQAWNLSYNVSAEFDDFRERYRWVIKGIEFLHKGIRYNEKSARLVWDIGWFTAQKIGRADERRQFRRLFREDDDFHGSRPPELRDNWLVGKEWFARAEALVDNERASLDGMSPVIFFSDRPMSQMNYSENQEEDGVFGEKARRSWNLAHREWTQGPLTERDQTPFGVRDVTTSFGDVIRLGDRVKYVKRSAEVLAELEAMEPGLRERIAAEKRAALSEEEREAVEIPFHERTEEQHALAFQVERDLKVSHEELAKAMTGAKRSRALEIAEELTHAEHMATIIGRYQEIVNYEFWERRARVEQTQQALDARQLTYEGNQAFAQGKLPAARQLYDAGLAKWREVLDMTEEFPDLVKDGNVGDELMDVIVMYRRILDARDEPFPEDFILQDIIDLHHQQSEDWKPLVPPTEEEGETEEE